MDIDELQEFIQNQTYADVSTEKYNELMEDAESMDFDSFVKKHDDFLKGNSQGWSELRTKSRPLPERMRVAFGSSDKENPFEQDKNFINELYEKNFKDVPREQFDQTLTNMKNYWDDEKKARDYEASKKEREREVKEWPLWKQAIASDYAKQRYIEEPEASIFSDKGKWYNKGEDVSDLIYGGTGAFADLIPGAGGTFIGPTVRSLRDIQHRQYDSKYQKGWGDIARDFGKDFAFNVGTDVLPTALTRYAPRITKNMMKGNAGSVVDFLADADKYNKVLKQSEDLGYDLKRFGFDEHLDNIDKFKDLTFTDLEKAIEKTKDPTLRKSLEGAVTRNEKGIIVDIDKNKVGDIITDYWTANKPGVVNENWSRFLLDNGEPTVAYKDVMNYETAPWIKAQMDASNISKNAKRLASAERAWQNFGDRAAKTLANMGAGVGYVGRPSTKTDEGKRQKQWFKKNYTRDWLMGFKPDEKPGDPLWEAYKEWKEENK